MLSLTQAQTLLQRGEISSRELVSACLERIAALDGAIHAFLYLDADGALKQADEADRKRKTVAGEHMPLLGVPIAIKDVLTVEGMPCTCGSKILEGYIPPFTATVVKKLQDAGAILLGKTNTDEFAMGSSTENSAYGPTRNPWDLSRAPGGSSGGSAAAVAAGFVPAALGTDTGGSVRQPASFCGVTGLKPTYGRASRYGLVAYGSSLDVVGVFAHSAADAAVVFSVYNGRDPLDATTQDVPDANIVLETEASASLEGIRIGVPKEYFIAGVQSEVEEAVRAAIQKMAELGADVREVSLPHTEYALPVYYLIATAEASANLARFDGVRYGPRVSGETMWDVFYKTRGEKFGDEVRRRIMLGTYALSAGYYDAFYGQAQKVRTLIRRDFEQVFEQVDVVACPVAPTTAFPLGAHRNDPLAMYLEDIFTLPANLAGVPGLAFPVGFDAAGLPIGMQLMGRHFDEATLFRLAHRYQQATEWHLAKPTIDN
ncbi:MAG: Asp-tRNA(Asn)/Glu-tRNA(Gln) amidotransferase subunit GatA [Anaerolineales bacterium]|nr:Asp-tRNA(Asn)/Glu-tRNA(Gln) amidotransferase subunit GatA [Anaerolineales bacterium]MDW8278751.1 Asp-tRNA(Asn)/Glu-tRNA(Gln) amidotransferase subunit GatA [Anaerolineales bacterium]